MKRFVLQHRYQDEGWQRLNGEEYDEEAEAILVAAQLSCDAICYGMVRVVDTKLQQVVTTFSAGVSE